jgi:hypothetical protein
VRGGRLRSERLDDDAEASARDRLGHLAVCGARGERRGVRRALDRGRQARRMTRQTGARGWPFRRGRRPEATAHSYSRGAVEPINAPYARSAFDNDRRAQRAHLSRAEPAIAPGAALARQQLSPVLLAQEHGLCHKLVSLQARRRSGAIEHRARYRAASAAHSTAPSTSYSRQLQPTSPPRRTQRRSLAGTAAARRSPSAAGVIGERTVEAPAARASFHSRPRRSSF